MCDWCDAVWHAQCMDPPMDHATLRNTDFACIECREEAEARYLAANPATPFDGFKFDNLKELLSPRFQPRVLRILDERLARDTYNRLFTEFQVQLIDPDGTIRPYLEWIDDTLVKGSAALHYWVFSRELYILEDSEIRKLYPTSTRGLFTGLQLLPDATPSLSAMVPDIESEPAGGLDLNPFSQLPDSMLPTVTPSEDPSPLPATRVSPPDASGPRRSARLSGKGS